MQIDQNVLTKIIQIRNKIEKCNEFGADRNALENELVELTEGWDDVTLDMYYEAYFAHVEAQYARNQNR